VPAAIEVHDLSFSYPRAPEPVLHRLSFALPAGSRCLLLGANGAGKSTLLRVIAGRHLLNRDIVKVLGRPAFHDASLAADVAFLGGPFPFSADISVREVLAARPGVAPELGRRHRIPAQAGMRPRRAGSLPAAGSRNYAVPLGDPDEPLPDDTCVRVP